MRVGRPIHGDDGARVPEQLGHELACLGIPHPDREVAPGGRDPAAVRLHERLLIESGCRIVKSWSPDRTSNTAASGVRAYETAIRSPAGLRAVSEIPRPGASILRTNRPVDDSTTRTKSSNGHAAETRIRRR